MDRRDCLYMALSLLKYHGLAGWSSGFHLNSQLGICDHQARRITFCGQLVDLSEDPTEIRLVILHEIAHALVGTNHDHDELWHAKAREIGARPEQYAKPKPLSDSEIAYLQELDRSKFLE